MIDTDLSFTNKFFTLTPIGSEVHLSKLPTSCNTDEVRVDYGDCDLSVVGGSLAMRCRGYSLDENEVLPIFQNVCQGELRESFSFPSLRSPTNSSHHDVCPTLLIF